MFFCESELGWEVIARTTLVGQKGHIPVAKYVSGRPGALVLTHVDGYGTGVFRKSTTWYRISKGQAVPMLSYPVDFYVVGADTPFDRKLATKYYRRRTGFRSVPDWSSPSRSITRLVCNLRMAAAITSCSHVSTDCHWIGIMPQAHSGLIHQAMTSAALMSYGVKVLTLG